jgi:nitroreductase
VTETIDLFEAISTTRAMRRLRPDPVPDALIARIIEAGVCAASGGNAQNWRFLVVKSPEIKKAVQVYYKRAFEEYLRPHYQKAAVPPGATRAGFDVQVSSVEHLTEHFHEAPVWIVPCLTNQRPSLPRWEGASIYPAVQNMLLAARALGLGATLTTRHLFYERETEEILGLPAGVHSYAILPIGYPLGNFGPVKRGPVGEVAYLDRWGEPFIK